MPSITTAHGGPDPSDSPSNEAIPGARSAADWASMAARSHWKATLRGLRLLPKYTSRAFGRHRLSDATSVVNVLVRPLPGGPATVKVPVGSKPRGRSVAPDTPHAGRPATSTGRSSRVTQSVNLSIGGASG